MDRDLPPHPRLLGPQAARRSAPPGLMAIKLLLDDGCGADRARRMGTATARLQLMQQPNRSQFDLFSIVSSGFEDRSPAANEAADAQGSLPLLKTTNGPRVRRGNCWPSPLGQQGRPAFPSSLIKDYRGPRLCSGGSASGAHANHNGTRQPQPASQKHQDETKPAAGSGRWPRGGIWPDGDIAGQAVDTTGHRDNTFGATRPMICKRAEHQGRMASATIGGQPPQASPPRVPAACQHIGQNPWPRRGEMVRGKQSRCETRAKRCDRQTQHEF